MVFLFLFALPFSIVLMIKQRNTTEKRGSVESADRWGKKKKGWIQTEGNASLLETKEQDGICPRVEQVREEDGKGEGGKRMFVSSQNRFCSLFTPSHLLFGVSSLTDSRGLSSTSFFPSSLPPFLCRSFLSRCMVFFFLRRLEYSFVIMRQPTLRELQFFRRFV